MDKDRVIIELYTCLLQASGCVKALESLSADLHLENSMQGLPRVSGKMKDCLEKHEELYRDLDTKARLK